MPESEKPQLRGEINEQTWILRSIDRAVSIRQNDKEKFKDAVAGVWNSLYEGWMRDRIVELLDEEMENKDTEEIKDYNEDGYETSYDLFNCLEDAFNGGKKDRSVKAAEVLLRKIQRVAKEANIISAKQERGSVKMRRRQVKEKTENTRKNKSEPETEPERKKTSESESKSESESDKEKNKFGYNSFDEGGF